MVVNNKRLRFSSPCVLSPLQQLFLEQWPVSQHALLWQGHLLHAGLAHSSPWCFNHVVTLFLRSKSVLTILSLAIFAPRRGSKSRPSPDTGRLSSGHGCGVHRHPQFMLPAESLMVLNGWFSVTGVCWRELGAGICLPGRGGGVSVPHPRSTMLAPGSSCFWA